MLQCFSLKIENKPVSIKRQIQFSFFNSGKYNINKDYYGILGLDKSVDQSEIKKEYYKLAKQYHPDVNPLASQKFKLINEAYEVLSDQKLKSEYDEARSISRGRPNFKSNNYDYQSQYQDENYQRASKDRYRKAYEQMNYDQSALIKQFTRRMIKLFGLSFFITLFLIAISPRNARVDQFGRPLKYSGQPRDIHGRVLREPLVYQNPFPIHDPFNLGGSDKNSFPYNKTYGNQYMANNPGNFQHQARPNPNQI